VLEWSLALALIATTLAFFFKGKGKPGPTLVCLLVGTGALLFRFLPLSAEAISVPGYVDPVTILNTELVHGEGEIASAKSQAYLNSLKPSWLDWLDLRPVDLYPVVEAHWHGILQNGIPENAPDILKSEAAILAYESGDLEYTLKLLTLKDKTSRHDLIALLNRIYDAHEPLTEKAESVEEVLTHELKPGWYRDCALARACEKMGRNDRLSVLKGIVDDQYKEIAAQQLKLMLVGSGIIMLGIFAFFQCLYLLLQKKLLKMSSSHVLAPQLKRIRFADLWLCLLTSFTGLAFIHMVFDMMNLRVLLRDESCAGLVGLIDELVQFTVFGIALYFCVFRLRKIPLLSSLGFRRPAVNLLRLLGDTVSVLALFILITTAVDLIQHSLQTNLVIFNPVVESHIQVAKEAATAQPFSLGAFGQYFAWLDVCLVAPLFEEIIFRGLLFAWLRNRLGFIYAALVSSAVFASSHFDAASFLLQMTFGILLSYLYEKDRTLVAPILCHIGRNAYAFAAINALFQGLV
jgi:membrane protease YdiL (CAAX protease family)